MSAAATSKSNGRGMTEPPPFNWDGLDQESQPNPNAKPGYRANPDYLRQLPDDLTERDQWVLWRFVVSDRRRTKLPFQVNGMSASTSSDPNAKCGGPKTWNSYEVVLQTYLENPGRYDGIGFVFYNKDPICGIDLDNCLDASLHPEPWAVAIVEQLHDCYMEISPSGMGLKIWVKAKLPGTGLPKDPDAPYAIEIYDQGRFFTVTGRVFNEAPRAIEEHQRFVEDLYRRHKKIAEDQTKDGASGADTSAKIGVGKRHKTLVSLAGTMRKRGLSGDAINAALQVFNIECCCPPKEKADVRKIADSAEKSWKPDADSYGHASVEENNPTPGVTGIDRPAPLKKAAFYGVAGEFVHIVEPETEADSAALLIQFLLACGILLGRHAHFRVGATRHYANLFLSLVGHTSAGRKGTAWNEVKACVRSVDRAFRLETGLSSGEGLIDAVRNPIKEMKFKRGATEGKLVVIDEGVADKRLCVVEEEFARTLKVSSGQTNILSSVVRSSWDDGDLSNLTKNNKLRATDAHIGIVGHITKDELNRLLTNTEAANGFGNRFLWAWSSRSKVLPEGGSLPDDALESVREGLRWAEKFAYPNMPPYVRDDDARALWHEVYEPLSEGKPGLLGAITARAAPQAMRLALNFAQLDPRRDAADQPLICLPHLEAGLAVWEYCESTAQLAFGEMLGDDMADDIWKYLKTAGAAGATRTDICQLFGGNKSSADIGRALALLARYGHATYESRTPESGRGRPIEWWCVCKR